MTFNAPSFFAGIGTMLALIVVGFGGGVLMSDVIFDHRSGTLTKTDRQASEQSRPPVPTNPVPRAPNPSTCEGGSSEPSFVSDHRLASLVVIAPDSLSGNALSL